jgi:glycosyltransferase involved in cell wall biosynthesis
MLLSVIIPSKNEESNIERCLESLTANNPYAAESEIILVDCASHDATVAIARGHPVKILQLDPGWPQSPAAARFIGTRFASSEFVFYMDADMTLEPGFIQQALTALKEDATIAGVGGIGNELYTRGGNIVGERLNLYRTPKYPTGVQFLGGAGLYRKNSVLEAGGFHPFLAAAEERELAWRLRKIGLKLISIPIPMISHYTAPLNEWEEFRRKKKAGFFFGIGQAIRICPDPGYLAETLAYYAQFSLFLAYIIFCALVACFALILGQMGYLSFALIPLILIGLGLFIKKKNIAITSAALLKWMLMSLDILCGFLKGSPDPRTYPRQPTIIKGEFHV